MMGHQPYCDHGHTLRQECNAARRIGTAAEWPPHDAPAELAAPSPTPLLEQPKTVPLSLRREAITASEMPADQGYVAPERHKTLTAVASPGGAGAAPEPHAASRRIARSSRKRAVGIAVSLLVVAGVAACFLHDANILGEE
jgi:hypothetical protein